MVFQRKKCKEGLEKAVYLITTGKLTGAIDSDTSKSYVRMTNEGHEWSK